MSDWSEVVSGAVGAGLVLVFQQGKQAWDDRRDSARIYQWLVDEAKKPGAKRRRTTRAIARAVNFTPERAAMLCHWHPRIYTSAHGPEDIWSLSPIKSGLQMQTGQAAAVDSSE
jgi:hypothetical protein